MMRRLLALLLLIAAPAFGQQISSSSNVVVVGGDCTGSTASLSCNPNLTNAQNALPGANFSFGTNAQSGTTYSVSNTSDRLSNVISTGTAASVFSLSDTAGGTNPIPSGFFAGLTNQVSANMSVTTGGSTKINNVTAPTIAFGKGQAAYVSGDSTGSNWIMLLGLGTQNTIIPGAIQTAVSYKTSGCTTGAHCVLSVLTDSTIVLNKGSGSASFVDLPACVTASLGLTFIVKDGKGDDASNAISVAPNGTDTIDATNSAITMNTSSARPFDRLAFQCVSVGAWSVE